jgi:CMP-N-acetylneuraminic acid synthetase
MVGIIPARGQSKRLPGKNGLSLGGLPLLAWSIRSARGSGVLTEVIVSTDDPALAELAVAHGALVHGLRPAALATDTAGTVDVLLHELEAFSPTAGRPPEAVMLLQPTSPFRRIETIRSCAALFARSGGRSVIGVSPARSHPLWCFRRDARGNLQPFVEGGGLALRSQDLPAAYEVNGLIYVVAIDYLRRERSLYTEPSQSLVVDDPVEALDIDTPFDWLVAQACVTELQAER